MGEQTITVEHSPLPWKWLPGEGQFIVSAKGDIVAEVPCQGCNPADGEFIVEAVNNYDSLILASQVAPPADAVERARDIVAANTDPVVGITMSIVDAIAAALSQVAAEIAKAERRVLSTVALKASDGDCFCAAVPQRGQVHSVRCEYVRERLEASRTADIKGADYHTCPACGAREDVNVPGPPRVPGQWYCVNHRHLAPRPR